MEWRGTNSWKSNHFALGRPYGDDRILQKESNILYHKIGWLKILRKLTQTCETEPLKQVILSLSCPKY